jgi:ABC-2 type transport system permease protein
MSTITATPLRAPSPADVAGIHTRPGLGRLVAIELRKIIDTRAGFWMQVATVALTTLVVVVRSATGEAADHTFAALLDVGLKPAAVLLPIAGILLVTSEWSQRTGMITFTLVPARSRVLAAKLVASLVLAFALLAVSVAIVAAGVLVAAPGVDGAWSHAPALIGQSAVYLGGGMLTGVAFGMVVLASAPAIVALFALPIAWTGVASLSVFAHAAPWLDTRLALGPLPQEVLNPDQWAQAGTALALWMVLPLLVGTWRITRREVAA